MSDGAESSLGEKGHEQGWDNRVGASRHELFCVHCGVDKRFRLVGFGLAIGLTCVEARPLHT